MSGDDGGDTDMQVLWLATVTYHLGLGMQQVVLGWVVLALTHSEAMGGRAMGSWIIGTGIGPVGHLEVGSLASLTNAHLALLVNGLALMMLTLGMVVCIPRLWRL